MNSINKITKRIIQKDSSILDALKVMDEQKVKLLFVFDIDNFLGVITIGDIQRLILKKVPLNVKVYEYLDKNKVYAYQDDTIESIKNKMIRLRAECMPILNHDGELIDVYFWEDFFKNELIKEGKKIDIPVVIMAGGLGSRLKPLTNIIPKPLLPINEKTIIEMIFEQFVQIGCSKFYVSANYKYEILAYYLENIKDKYDITLYKEDKPLGTIGSLSLLKGKINTPFFVSNCDIMIDQDYRDMYDYHMENNNDITLITAVKTYPIPYGVVETGENGIMLELTEKPELTYMINTGVYILQPELINEIPENTLFHITDLFDKVKTMGGKIGCFPVTEKSWIDIGNWEEYLQLIRK